jgi:hypothetical protein
MPPKTLKNGRGSLVKKRKTPLGIITRNQMIIVLIGFIIIAMYLYFRNRKRNNSIIDYYATSCSNTTNSSLCESMTVFYSTITPTDDAIYLFNDVWSSYTTRSTQTYNIYNVYISYYKLAYTGTATKFTSYYEYCDSTGTLKTNVDYTITFFSGSTSVVMGSTTGTITKYTLPFQGMSGTFCLPLIPIPTTATNIAFGIQLITTTGTYTQTVKKSTSTSINYTDSTYMRTFISNIYDNETLEYSTSFPSVTVNYVSTKLPSGVSMFSASPSATSTPISGGITLNNYRTLIFTTLNSLYSYYNVTLYTTSFSDLADNPASGKAKLYFSSVTTPTPKAAVGLGCWFIPSSSTTATPSCYTSSTPNISLTSKMNNFTTYGLDTTLISSASYKVTPSKKTIAGVSYPMVTVSGNLYPVHPYGTFPSSTVRQLSAYVATNPKSILSQSLSADLVASTSSTSQPLSAGVIGYLFDNAGLYAAGDADGYTPITLECLDMFFGHPDSSSLYHHHFIGPTMTNWCISTTLRIIGFVSDGYPLVAPFLIMDTSESIGYRFVKTSDLNKYHGLEGSFTIAMPDSTTSTTTTSLTYGFIYVTTYDFPFTTSAFYGKPTSL